MDQQSSSAPSVGDLMEQPKTPKEQYRLLKRRFKFLVYENECYQEELRNLQRKLLKLSRDKNFLLDRLLQYEALSDSSDESDTNAAPKVDEKKPKKRARPSQSRKKATPTTTANSTTVDKKDGSTNAGTGTGPGTGMGAGMGTASSTPPTDVQQQTTMAPPPCDAPLAAPSPPGQPGNGTNQQQQSVLLAQPTV